MSAPCHLDQHDQAEGRVVRVFISLEMPKRSIADMEVRHAVLDTKLKRLDRLS